VFARNDREAAARFGKRHIAVAKSTVKDNKTRPLNSLSRYTGGLMPTRRTIVLTAALLTAGGVIASGGICPFGIPQGLAAPPAPGPADAAKAFVTKIYDAYKGKSSKGIVIHTDTANRAYFEPSLAALITKDDAAAAKRKDAPALDFDPFVDGQEWEVTDLNIAVNGAPTDKATATVNFKNFGMPTKIVLSLVKVKTDWRITNITWSRDGNPATLLELYKH
jgi:hypothetical protein